MKIFRTSQGAVVENDGRHYVFPDFAWDELFKQADLPGLLHEGLKSAKRLEAFSVDGVLAPIVSQEVWAAGVTYYRSRTARMEESEQGGGKSFYDKVYEAERPELFFKATAHRTVAHNQAVVVRSDSSWTVPEPELTLAINCAGRIIGYTIGNDMSARDIEGENPLYLPQAKVYDGCCSLGPGILISEGPRSGLPPETGIQLEIQRDGRSVFEGSTTVSIMKREPEELAQYLFRASSFPAGCFLLTGTGIVPPSDFSLRAGDRIGITIEPIGTLVNTVRQSG
jgi:2-dehydro-3-deoxy-D-arabinonate dehydratase